VTEITRVSRNYANWLSRSSAKTYELLTNEKNRSILKTVSDDARTLITSRSARTATQKNVLESSLSLIGDEEFDFDDIVVNSTAYRRAFLANQARQTQSIQTVTTQKAIPSSPTFPAAQEPSAIAGTLRTQATQRAPQKAGTPLAALGRGAAPVDCPACGKRGLTRTAFESSSATQ
jgi:hypothetical protein